MPTIANNEDLNEQFSLITLLGEEIIPTHMEIEWRNYIKRYQSMDPNDVMEFLDQCNVIVKYLLKFKNNKSGKEVAKEFYQTFNYKNRYSKGIADVIASFAPFPENVHFIQSYYESFLEITPEEESALTDRITRIKTINDMMNLGLSYENAQSLSAYSMMNICINGETITVMYWTNNIYCGVNEKNDLISYEQIGDDFDVVYIVKEDGAYTRLINRHPKLTPEGMLASKTLITDEKNKVVGVEDYDILVNPNFFDAKQKVAYYQKVCSRVNITDSLTSLDITQEAIKLTDIVDDENHTLCATIFDKMLKEEIAKKSETK